MCGRTALSLNRDTICCACSYKPKESDTFVRPDWLDEFNGGKEYNPSYNIAPTDVTPVLVSSSKFRINKGTSRILKPMKWGMIPPWEKDNTQKSGLHTHNCRLENIMASKLYHPALKGGGRCVIVVEGFYEWQTTDKTSKTKQPYYIYPEQDVKAEDSKHNIFSEESGWNGIRLLYIAGLFNTWKLETDIKYSYTAITMNSNSTMDWLHHRMPAILENEEQIDAWLDVDNVKYDMAIAYLRPTTILKWHPVSTNVNNSRYKSDDCNKIIPLQQKSSSSQKTLTNWIMVKEKRKSDNKINSEEERPLKLIKKDI